MRDGRRTWPADRRLLAPGRADTAPPSFVLSLGDPRRGVATPPSGGAQTGKSDYAATAPQCCPPVPRSGGPTAGFHRWPWSGKVVSFPSVDSGTCGSPGQRWTKVVPVRADRQRRGPLQGVCGPGRAVSRALNHRAELLVLPSPPQGDRSRRVQRPRRSHGAAVSLSARHASGPGPRSDVTPRAAKRSGQLRPGDKAPPIRRPNAASAHGFSRFRGFARRGRCFAVPRLQPDGPGQPGSHARRLVSCQPRWQPRALVSQPRSFPEGGGGGRIPPASARVTFANAPLVRARSTAETSLCMEVADSRSGHGARGDLGDCLLNGPLHAHRPHFTAQETGLREATELVPSHHGCHWAELSLRPGSALRPALCISSPFSDLSR